MFERLEALGGGLRREFDGSRQLWGPLSLRAGRQAGLMPCHQWVVARYD